MADVTLTDNSDEVLSSKEKAIRKALKAIGMTAEKYAKQATPVDTGRLRNSITWAISGKGANRKTYKSNSKKDKKTYKYTGTAPNDAEDQKAVYIGSNVEYATYVENGSLKVPAYHFLQEACLNHSKEYEEFIQAAFKSESD